MIERRIDVVTIGFIFAALPLVFQFVRLICGAISDIIGRKLFFVSNSFLNIILLVIYYIAYSPLEFLFGKITEGIKNASLWSVNRAALLDQKKDKRGLLSKMMGIAHIGDAAGRIIAGFLIAWIFYENTVLFCILLSLLIVPGVLSLKGKKRKRIRIERTFSILDIRKRSKFFKRFALISFITGLSSGLIYGYIFPLFLKEGGFGTEIIGIIIGLNILLIGIFSILTRKIEIKKLVLYAGISYFFLMILLGFSNYSMAALIIIALGIARGMGHGVFEGIISKASSINSYGGDVGMLTTGLQIGQAISLAFSGFIITYIGFFGLFSLSALFYIIYCILTYLTFKKI